MAEGAPDADLTRALDDGDRHHVGYADAPDDDRQQAHRNHDQLELTVALGRELQSLGFEFGLHLGGPTQTDSHLERLGRLVFGSILGSHVELVGHRVGFDEVLVGGLEGDEHGVVERRLELHCGKDSDHGVVVAVEHDRTHLARQVLELSRQTDTDDSATCADLFVEIVEPASAYQRDLQHPRQQHVGGEHRYRHCLELLARLLVGGDDDVRKFEHRRHGIDGYHGSCPVDRILGQNRILRAEGACRRRLDEVGAQLGHLALEVTLGAVGEADRGDDRCDPDCGTE